ncbi:MAG: ABC transporter substrate-binding protein [Proteobacteria bacterium]|nr:ABC transporter substrate-binding protein [Pseudomonadota bacterium]
MPINEYGENGTFSKMAHNKIRRLKSGDDQKERSVTGKSDQQLAGEALIRGRKMIEELTANAENLMESERLSVPERVAKFRGLLGTIVDFKPMARFTLGAYYDKATPEQWDRFLATYKEMFLSGYGSPRPTTGRATSRSRASANTAATPWSP